MAQQITIKEKRPLGTAEIYVDGVKLERVRSYGLKGKGNSIPTLHLELDAVSVTVDGNMELYASDMEIGIVHRTEMEEFIKWRNEKRANK